MTMTMKERNILWTNDIDIDTQALVWCWLARRSRDWKVAYFERTSNYWPPSRTRKIFLDYGISLYPLEMGGNSWRMSPPLDLLGCWLNKFLWKTSRYDWKFVFVLTKFGKPGKTKFGQHKNKFWGYGYNDVCYNAHDKIIFHYQSAPTMV